VLPQVRCSLARIPVEPDLKHQLHRSYKQAGLQDSCSARRCVEHQG
jgi:hypothetical protein